MKEMIIKVLYEPIRFLTRRYWSVLEDATLQNLPRYATFLSKLQKGAHNSSTFCNTHGDTRRWQKQLTTYTERKKVTSGKSIEQHRGSISTSSPSDKTSERFGRRKSRESSRSGQESNRLGIAPVITPTQQAAAYSNPSLTRNNKGAYWWFCSESSCI